MIVDVAELVAKSLAVTASAGSEPRLRLLETTRSYAFEKLSESGELEAIRRRHAIFLRDLLEGAAGDRADRDYPAEINNIRAALAWAFSPAGDATIGVALAASSAPTWMEMALLLECRGWMAAALDVLPTEAVDTRQEMALQLALGYSTMLTQGLSDPAHAALVRANELGKAFDDLDYQLRALIGLVIFSRMSADFSPALTRSREVDAIAKEIATPLALATADCLLASSLLWVGEYGEARIRAERASGQTSLEVRRAHLARYCYDHRMNSRTLLAQILWVQGFPEQSLQLTRDVLSEAEQTSHPFTLPYALSTAGCFVLLWIGDLAMAERAIGQLKAHTETYGLRNYYAAALGFEGQLYAARGETAAGEGLLRRSVAELRETGFYMLTRQLSRSWRRCWGPQARLMRPWRQLMKRSRGQRRTTSTGACRKRYASRAKSCCSRAKATEPRQRSISANPWGWRSTKGRWRGNYGAPQAWRACNASKAVPTWPALSWPQLTADLSKDLKPPTWSRRNGSWMS